MDEKEKKSLQSFVNIFSVSILLFLILIILFIILMRPVIKTYSSYEEILNAEKNSHFFKANDLINPPDNAQNCKFAIAKNAFTKAYLCSFTLSEADYREYTASLIEKYDLESQDEDKQNYSYAKWYEMKVADCGNDDYELDDFPTKLRYDLVSDTPIEEYTILVYSPQYTGSHTWGIVTLPEECRIIIMDAGSIK